MVALLAAIGVSLVVVRGVRSQRGGTEAFTTPRSTETVLTVIHAEWCGHCKRLLAPGGVWSEVKKKLPGVRIEEVDEAKAPDVIQQLNVTSFPDIRILRGNTTVARFEGPRDVGSIVQFALKHVS